MKKTLMGLMTVILVVLSLSGIGLFIYAISDHLALTFEGVEAPLAIEPPLVIASSNEEIKPEPLAEVIPDALLMPPPEAVYHPYLTQQLNEFMRDFHGISLYFASLTEDFTFMYEPDRVFFAASVTKAPFALYIYQKADRGETDLSSLHEYTPAFHAGGSGIIRHNYQFGDLFTQGRLLALNLYESDNVATRILRGIHGYDSYRDFIQSIGGTPNFTRTIAYSYLTAREAGLYARAIHNYIESGAPHSREFQANLLSNRFPFIQADYHIASKSGWWHGWGGAFHDMAIVYAPAPYLLAILSNRYGDPEIEAVFYTISMFIQEFNRKWFTTPSL